MKRTNHLPFCFAACLLLTATLSFAQSPVEPVRRNTFFLELGGNGMFYSLNYDRILLNRDKWKLSGRVGALYVPSFKATNRHMVGAPVEISYLRGRGKHFLEVGLGLTGVYDTYPLSDTRIREVAVMGVARVGYRYQQPEGGLFFKAGFTPLGGTLYNVRDRRWATQSAFAYPLVGLAVGYTLK